MMPANVRHGLWCIWSAGALVWVIGHSGEGGRFWLPAIVGPPSLPLPDPNSAPGMPALPGDTLLLVLLQDAVLPPLLVLLAGLLLGWIVRGIWKT